MCRFSRFLQEGPHLTEFKSNSYLISADKLYDFMDICMCKKPLGMQIDVWERTWLFAYAIHKCIFLSRLHFATVPFAVPEAY